MIILNKGYRCKIFGKRHLFMQLMLATDLWWVVLHENTKHKMVAGINIQENADLKIYNIVFFGLSFVIGMVKP